MRQPTFSTIASPAWNVQKRLSPVRRCLRHHDRYSPVQRKGGSVATGAENAKAPGASETGRSGVCYNRRHRVRSAVTTLGTFGLIGASTLTVWFENSKYRLRLEVRLGNNAVVTRGVCTTEPVQQRRCSASEPSA